MNMENQENTLEIDEYMVDLNGEENIGYIEKNISDVNFSHLSYNETLNIDFIRKFRYFVNWNVISTNFMFSYDELIEFKSFIDWNTAVLIQEVDEQFIKDNKLEHVIEHHNDIHDRLQKSEGAADRVNNIRNIIINIGETLDDYIDIVSFYLLNQINFKIFFIDENNQYYNKSGYELNCNNYVDNISTEKLMRTLTIDMLIDDDFDLFKYLKEERDVIVEIDDESVDVKEVN